MNLKNKNKNKSKKIRWCENGCGYKLPEEYGQDETICGACLNEIEENWWNAIK